MNETIFKLQSKIQAKEHTLKYKKGLLPSANAGEKSALHADIALLEAQIQDAKLSIQIEESKPDKLAKLQRRIANKQALLAQRVQMSVTETSEVKK